MISVLLGSDSPIASGSRLNEVDRSFGIDFENQKTESGAVLQIKPENLGNSSLSKKMGATEGTNRDLLAHFGRDHLGHLSSLRSRLMTVRPWSRTVLTFASESRPFRDVNLLQEFAGTALACEVAG